MLRFPFSARCSRMRLIRSHRNCFPLPNSAFRSAFFWKPPLRSAIIPLLFPQIPDRFPHIRTGKERSRAGAFSALFHTPAYPPAQSSYFSPAKSFQNPQNEQIPFFLEKAQFFFANLLHSEDKCGIISIVMRLTIFGKQSDQRVCAFARV